MFVCVWVREKKRDSGAKRGDEHHLHSYEGFPHLKLSILVLYENEWQV